MAVAHHILARNEAIGTLSRCPHGCFHLQIGRTNVAMTEAEYVELVALVNESAASYELFRSGAQDVLSSDDSGECLSDGDPGWGS